MSDPLTIAPANDTTREWVAALMAGSEPWTTLGRSLDQCRSLLARPGFLLYVALSGSQPLGFLYLHRYGLAGSPYVASIAVADAARGRGIGAQLMTFAEDLFRQEARHLFLCVSSFNAGARRFYERLGYAAVGELPDYIVKGASEIVMHKRLEPPDSRGAPPRG